MLQAQPRPAARQGASVSGTVVDSVAGRVLGGATVQLVHQDSAFAAGRTVESNPLGEFRFTDVRPGRYLLGFEHPALDALGLEPTPVTLAVSAGRSQRADLAIPSAATLRMAVCGETAIRDSIGLVIGHARRERDRARLDSVVITVQSRSSARDAGQAGQPPRLRRVATSSTGWFVVCGVLAGDTIQLSASRTGVVAAAQSLMIPASGLLQHDVLLSAVPAPDATAGVTARDTMPSRGPHAPSGFVVAGIVSAADGGRPIAGAVIGIAGGTVTRSDAQGAWRISGVGGGTQSLTVRAVRYTPQRVTISVTPQLAPIRLVMRPLQAVLDTVNVVEDAVTDRSLLDFLERRRTRGSGTFLSQEDITSRRPTLTSDLFPALQGGMTIERDTLGNKFITMPSNTFRSNRCLPSIFLDGMSLRGLTTQDLDALVRPGELFGIEVYRASNAPVEFSEQDGCGTILFWTRR